MYYSYNAMDYYKYIYIYCCCEIFEAARPFCCSGKCVSIQQFSAGTHCVGSPYNLPKPLKGRDREWRRKRLEDEINGAVQSFRTQMTHAGNCCCEIFEAARPFCCSGKCVSIQQFSAGTHCVGSPYNLPKPLKGRDREWRRKRLEDEINGAVQSFRTQMTHAGNCCCEIFEAARPFCCSGKCVSIQQFSAGTHCVGSPYNLPLCTKYL